MDKFNTIEDYLGALRILDVIEAFPSPEYNEKWLQEKRTFAWKKLNQLTADEKNQNLV